MDASHPVALELTTDLALGGRWTSLRSGGREWLWRNPDAAIRAARGRVNPDDPFVDAGGGEECFPCIRAPFDHGLAWSRPWQQRGAAEGVAAGGYDLHRTRGIADGVVTVRYVIGAEAPLPAIHATHLLLDLSEDAELHPGPHAPLVFWDPRPDAEIASLGGEDAFVRALGRGVRSAVAYSLPDCRTVTVVDGDDALELTLAADDPEVPLGFVIWRNLRGWPAPRPYRSIGVEPAVGWDVSLPPTIDRGAVALGPGRDVSWTLTLRARRTTR